MCSIKFTSIWVATTRHQSNHHHWAPCENYCCAKIITIWVVTTRHRSVVGRGGRKAFVRDKGLAHQHVRKSDISNQKLFWVHEAFQKATRLFLKQKQKQHQSISVFIVRFYSPRTVSSWEPSSSPIWWIEGVDCCSQRVQLNMCY